MPTPKSVADATALAEAYAANEAMIDAIEATRNAAIVDANVVADKECEPLLKQRADLAAKLSKWWGKGGADLLDGKRKSIELGGCTIGTRSGRDTLKIAGDEADALAILKTLRWAKPFVRIKPALDRAALLKGLDGPRKLALAELGVMKVAGEEQFFVEPVKQTGTISG